MYYCKNHVLTTHIMMNLYDTVCVVFYELKGDMIHLGRSLATGSEIHLVAALFFWLLGFSTKKTYKMGTY